MMRREPNKRGHIPLDAPPILERLDFTADMWLGYTLNFRDEAGLASARQAF